MAFSASDCSRRWRRRLLVLSALASVLSRSAAEAAANASDDDSSDEYVRCTSFEQCCAMWGDDSKRCERGPCSEELIMRKFFSLSMPLQSVGLWDVVCTFYSMMPYLALIAIIVEALVRSRRYTRVFAILLPILLTVFNTVILVRIMGDCDECPRPAGSCLVSNGLPSGHATNAVGLGIWIVLEALAGVGVRRRQWSVQRRALAVVAAILVFAPVPYSRYYLGDHTALQVAVGSADGLVLAVLYFFFIRWWAVHRVMDLATRGLARFVKFTITDDFYANANATLEASADDSTIAEDSSESEAVAGQAMNAVDKEAQTAYVQA